MRLEVFLPQPEHFMQPGIVGAQHRITGGGRELLIKHRAQRVRADMVSRVSRVSRVSSASWASRASSGQHRREAVIAVAAILLFLDEPGVLEKAKMAGHAGLRQAQHAGQLRNVQPFAREQAQQPEAPFVTEEPKQRGRRSHIYKSTLID